MFYLIWKEKGESSFSAISKFRRENDIKKIGHTGTLDPLADGLLIVATDRDTKWIPYIDNSLKQYYVEATLGYSTTTYDSEGEIVNSSNKKVNLDNVIQVINSIPKQFEQVAPKYSARKINGKRAYALARQGIDFEIKPNTVQIESISNLKFDFENQVIKFDVLVSKGTYIRSLVHEIGLRLETFATMTHLTRTKLGKLDKDKLGIIPLRELLEIPILTLDKESINTIHNGIKTKLNIEDGIYVYKDDESIIGVIEVQNGIVKLKKRILLNKE
ncbi:tRNA pseudouridine synthase B [Mycoplasma testudineum]|uniref:tRNA pseudouridine synthase B n=1 Tax=Mycoplasma testudineum TaxID=244584 RepID=A0A4R6IA96_9MOLU|nr:tRNA pseudouridine(55) synthase TruB [Mycoplasma testudineum]OYD26538.1 tRNA pseudouridine(55) synthase TruB [Mycoplasma testudineum]TDO19123.1 tRNA pseudouridine synthase B [Mycoplasma testudineum]